MLTPVIRQTHSSQTPWQVYQGLYRQSQISFFLDSHHYAPPSQAYSYMGMNPFLQVYVESGKVFVEESGKVRKENAEQLFEILRDLFSTYQTAVPQAIDFFAGGAVGYWGYEVVSLFEKIQFKDNKRTVPDLYLGFYQDLIVYDHAKSNYTLITHVAEDRDKESTDVVSKLDFLESCVLNPTAAVLDDFYVNDFRPETPRHQFEEQVKKIKDYIMAGDIYQANLSQRFAFEFGGDALQLYDGLRKINPSPFSSFLKINDLHVVSSSPERLIQKRGRWCQTDPIAGTRPRLDTQGKELDLSEELLANEKERAEHIMLVDLERNDLGRVCEWPSVKVKDMMKIEKYSHVIHLVSTVIGQLREDKDGFDLIQAMFPGGTITGCPKIRCMQIIDELEQEARGIYTGSIGFIGFDGDLDLNIVIRTLVLQNQKGYLQVGAGIVYDSDSAREYEETLHKGEALVQALSHASANVTTPTL